MLIVLFLFGLLDSMTDHKRIWSDFSNAYTIKLLNLGLNCVPVATKQFAEMNENEFNKWLSSINFEESGKSPRPYILQEEPLSSVFNISSSVTKTETLILPLSLEDNSTLPGTASIFETFGKEFSIPCIHKDEILEFDEKTCSFDLKGARNHYEFKEIISLHKDEMALIEQKISDTSKQLDEDNDDDDEPEDVVDSDGTEPKKNDGQHNEDPGNEGSSAIHIKRKYLQKQDAVFKKTYDKLTKMIWEAVHAQDSATKLDILISRLSNNRWWERKTDHFKRTVIHHAIECNNIVMVRVLLAAGINPNVKEGCGATPLHLAVIQKNTELCKLFVDSFACINGLSFSSIPSPYEMAKSMKLNDIVLIFNENLEEQGMLEQQLLELSSKAACETNSECEPDQDENDDELFSYDRSQYCGFPTAVVGDQGTCKNNRSVKQRDQAAFSWVAEIPGDLHAKGHLCEATFKAQGKGGFHHLVTKVLKRQKLTEAAFRDKKFQEQNLAHIKEAVRDGSIAYGMAAVMIFKTSCYFPSKESLQKCLQKNGNHNEVLLHCFKSFLNECSAKDENFKYHSEMFTLFGPLLHLYNDATRFGQGLARETVWVLLLPIFAQLQFRNYWTEAIVHVVNFTAVWPLAFREMIKKNSSVNISGQVGKNIDLDEFVETYIVRPLKLYASGNLSIYILIGFKGTVSERCDFIGTYVICYYSS